MVENDGPDVFTSQNIEERQCDVPLAFSLFIDIDSDDLSIQLYACTESIFLFLSALSVIAHCYSRITLRERHI